MHIAVLHDWIRETDGPDAMDVLDQADAVEAALTALGHTVYRVSCDLNLVAVYDLLNRDKTDLAFNLVESIGGQGRLIHLFPFVLDALSLPYTGAPAEAMVLTSNKLIAKTWMTAAAIPTPAWIDPGAGKKSILRNRPEIVPEAAMDWIVKSVWEHASIGMGPDSLVRNAAPDAVRKRLAAAPPSPVGPFFAEAFIAGREFNVSLLAAPEGPMVLPVAEIMFDGYTDDMPRIVDYKAKWDPTAFEYHHTRRRFGADASDTQLLESLKTIALDCWYHFGLAGYARVDFRVDEKGNPFVLEVNANPCLSPDAGFAAALKQAGISFKDAVARILEDVRQVI